MDDNYKISESFLSRDNGYVTIKSVTSINYNYAGVTKFRGMIALVTPMYHEFIDKLKKLLNVEVILVSKDGKVVSTLYDEAHRRLEKPIKISGESKV